MNDPLFDFKEGRHFRTRAAGQLYIGPLQRDGYNNQVLKLTLQDMDFGSYSDADRFIRHKVNNRSSKNGLIRQRRLKLESISSD